MKGKWFAAGTLVAGLTVFLTGCGDVYTSLAVEETYSVATFLGSRNLDDYALVRAGDQLRPVFLAPVADDPDLTGLSVVLLDASGRQAGDELVYSTLSEVDSPEGSAPRSVRVPDFDAELPAFTVPPELSVGTYTLALRVIGKQGTLSETRQTFFYLADAEFNLRDVRNYPPGTAPADRAPLFPPGIKVLLQASIDADPRLDPYVVWTYGDSRLAAGRAADGAGQLLWQLPDREGFHTLGCTIFPLSPGDDEEPALPGEYREVTIAVSSRAAIPGLAGSPADFNLLYRFLGDLEGSAAGDVQALTPVSAAETRWRPLDDSYGLEIGPADVLVRDIPPLPVYGGNVAPGRITLRLAPLAASGSVFWAEYDFNDDKVRSLTLELRLTEGSLALDLAAGDQLRTLTAALPAFPGFVTVDIDVRSAAGAVSAALSLAGAAGAATRELLLPDALSGAGSLRIGGPLPEAEPEEPAPSTAVIDELAVTLDNRLRP